MKLLTKKQSKLLGHILGFADFGQTPTHRELSTLMGTSAPAVSIMLKGLERKGYVKLDKKWRQVIVTAKGLQALEGKTYDSLVLAKRMALSEVKNG